MTKKDTKSTASDIFFLHASPAISSPARKNSRVNDQLIVWIAVHPFYKPSGAFQCRRWACQSLNIVKSPTSALNKPTIYLFTNLSIYLSNLI